MRPDFTLSLSFDGIALLHRQDAGWSVVGEIPLDTPDLKSALRELRADADARGPNGGQVKVLIPNEQIRYFAIPDTGASGDTLLAQIHSAVDGETPYRLSELVLDWSRKDGMVRIAAVAQETLSEAEVFASGHGFEPVCHVARPPDGAFDGEVFFGPVTGWDGPAPERDTQAVHVLYKSNEALDALLAEQAEATKAPVAPEPPEPVAEVKPEEPPAKQSAAPEPKDTPKPAPVAKVEDPAPEAAETPEEQTPEEAPEEAPVPFTSVRAKADVGTSPTLPGAERATPDPVAAAMTATTPLAFKSKPPADVTAPDLAIAPEPDAPAPKDRGRIKFFARREKPEVAPAKAPPAKAEVTAGPAPDAPAPKKVLTTALQRKIGTPAAEAAVADPAALERQRMTVFGAREPQKIGGKPKHLGLMLTAALLVMLLGVAAWASVFFDEGLARWFGSKPQTEVAETSPAPEESTPVAIVPDATPAPPSEPTLEVAALDPPAAPDETARAITQTLPPEELSPEAAQVQYAATGIWQRAPQAPALPGTRILGDMEPAGIDPQTRSVDAVALAALSDVAPDPSIPAQTQPFAPGIRFNFDDRGVVVATPEGVITPDGVRVIKGRPPVTPPERPAEAALLAQDPDALAAMIRMRSVRPQLRPNGLIENAERVELAGRTRVELAAIRPVARAVTAQEDPEVESDATDRAIRVSIKPMSRPRDFARIVERAVQQQPQPQETQVAAVAPRTVQPNIPSSASVARQATVRNAINLNRINLIGVYGTQGNRRALVRLANGRYQKVKVGDRLDGGRVAAIGEEELRYTKSGRNVSLKMPR